MEEHMVVIIGSGPAAYTAAIYCARAEMNPVCFEGFFSGPIGGQLMTTTEVENFPGFPDGLTGPDLMTQFKKQAQRFGTQFYAEDVTSVDLSSKPFKIKSKKREILAHSVIVATGATAKKLDIPGSREGELWQKGVTACAICDGAMPMFREQNLFVVGGGDSAVEEALFLTKYGKKVFMVHRRDQLRASKIMANRAIEHPKIEILWDSVVVEVSGDNKVEQVCIENVNSKKQQNYEAAGLFFSIGHQPNTKFLEGQLDLHDNGYIKVQAGTSKTSVEGVFAAGDVQDYTYRQAITAAGSGCMAALDAERYVSEMQPTMT
ncbi:MAG: thioredoxin-disulfide reductase [Chlamydiales bacterium]|nr:thioredoxin-disulfide reductase [Chlamydiales bacterium]NCF71050.1 thioredoxin-disulfide reductase [Chlamydiales bacterium]